MRILIWGINYAPEPTGIGPYTTELAEWLAARGHEVHVLTAFTYYPAWKKSPADTGRWFRDEAPARGLRVHRCYVHVPPVVTSMWRVVHEASFVAASLLRGLVLPACEVAVVVSPPLGLGPAAAMLGALRGTPFVFHLQDLQPDAALELGLLPRGRVARLLHAVERLAYARAALVSVITPVMAAKVRAKGGPAAKVIETPNWTRGSLAAASGAAAAAFRARQGWGAGDFVLSYSGNLGAKQGLEALLEAARLLGPADAAGRRWRWVLAGAGVEAMALRAAAADVPQVSWLPV